MIIDTLKNAEKYFCLNPLFEKAFEYLKTIDLDKIEAGKYNIDNDRLSAIVSVKPGKTVEESIAKFECHNKHIDIQLCIRGKEQVGWKPRDSCVLLAIERNEKSDFIYYNDVPDMFFELTHNQFAIFFPEDVHAPMIGNEEIKKMVIKVKI